MDVLNERHQKATYWANPQPNGTGGYSYDTPVVLSVRWQEQFKLFSDPTSESSSSDAMVWVDRTLDVGGYLTLGESSESDPANVTRAYKIKKMIETPSIDGTTSERVAVV